LPMMRAPCGTATVWFRTCPMSTRCVRRALVPR